MCILTLLLDQHNLSASSLRGCGGPISYCNLWYVTFRRAICHLLCSTWICRIFSQRNVEIYICDFKLSSKIRAAFGYTNICSIFIDFRHKPFKAHFFSSIQKRIWSMYLYTRNKQTYMYYIRRLFYGQIGQAKFEASFPLLLVFFA